MIGALLGSLALIAAPLLALWLAEHTTLFDTLSDWLLTRAGGWGE